MWEPTELSSLPPILKSPILKSPVNYWFTIGDRINLGDTNLIAEIERDFTYYGDELTVGIEKVTQKWPIF